MPVDVIIDPSSGQIYWNDNAGSGSTQSIAISGNASDSINFVGYSNFYSAGGGGIGTNVLATFNDSATATLVPGTNGYDLGSDSLRWELYATNINASGTFTLSSSTASTSTTTGALIVTGGVGIGGSINVGGVSKFTSSATSTSTSTGALIITGGVGIGGSINVGDVSKFTSSTASTTSSSGAVVITGGLGVGGSINAGTAVSTPLYSSPSAIVFRPGADTGASFQFCKTGTGATIMVIDTLNSRVGIGLTNPEYDLEVAGEISATLKSFIIDHPTKPGMRLRYTSLEGPENGVYFRGELKDKNVIELPDYWTGLVDETTITVHLTPIGNKTIFVKEIKDNKVFVGARLFQKIHCFYSVWAERKDVPKLKVEI
jgi:hypothetical protein